MQKIIQHRIPVFIFRTGMILLLAAAIFWPAGVKAADQPVSVTYCKINSSGSRLIVKAKVSKKTKEMGKKLYLINLNAYLSETGKKSATPLASVKAKKGTVTFKAKYKESMLFQKFAVACKSGKKYKIISNVRYITNPEVLASYKGKGPSAPSKKGLQVEELSDSLEIGTKHAVVNWTLNSLLNQKAAHKISFQYKNKTYYLDQDILQRNDELVQAYNAAGVRVTVILLLPKDSGSKGTLSMQFGGHSSTQYSSVKTSTKAGCQTFEAVMTYLAGRYGTKENLVCGWILGNEINSAVVWNYGGNRGLDNYMANYARSFRICYNAVKSVSKNSKVYISLDNNWNQDYDGKGARYFSSKAVLDKFYSKLKASGKIGFQIAYHAYPQGMGDPIFWDDSQASNSESAKIINFKNLSVLTKYVKKKFGSSCKIMLSEQSFNSSRGEAVQAAAYAYAYYMCEGNSMIEAFIYGREFDHPVEMNSGYRWGLCDQWHVKRLIWSVFQYIDTKDSFQFTDPLLKYTNLKKWSKISGFKKTFYTKKASIRKKASLTDIESASTTSLLVSWGKINTGDGYELYRNNKLIATIPGNSTVQYTDKGLAAGASYAYKVRIYKEAPKSSNANKRVKLYGSFSDTKSASVSVARVKLNDKKHKVNGNRITIAWEKASGASGYEIFRSSQKDGAYTAVGTASSAKTSYTDTAPVSGATYYYKVRAYVTVNGQNYYGRYSDATGQLASIQLSAKSSGGSVALSWTRWLNVTDYRVYCKPSSLEDFVLVKTVDNALEFVCDSFRGQALDPKQSYSFRVRAVLGVKRYGAFSNETEVSIDLPVSPTGWPEEILDEAPVQTQDPEPVETPEPAETPEPIEALESAITQDPVKTDLRFGESNETDDNCPVL